MAEGRHCGLEAAQDLMPMEEKSASIAREPVMSDSDSPREDEFPKAQQDPQLPQDGPWKFVCLAMVLILLLLVIILGVDLVRVLLFLNHVRDELKQIDTQFSQGLADGGHKRDAMWGEMFRQVEALQAGNGSSCEPCPEDWLAFGGSCYYFSTHKETYKEAKVICAKDEAHLVIINSQAEQNFLAISKGDKKYWIGLRRQYPKDIHTWEDGSVPTFTNWDEEVSGFHYLAYMKTSGHWSNYYGIDVFSQHWICEKPQIC